ncbi:hypothetical protein F5144DRAFT_130276 [Chaetomium tenue]|uniref:Uncharacterized protein n=1 Tax=Chaetomium tenue TaxID=1854479 RepID=A0ACB7PIG9_9PEZI|nr:hypothetical protein F5144DRAFT_130276 [Chaetomium globosum]
MRCGQNWDPLDRAAEAEPQRHLYLRIAGPADFLGRPRLSREPQPFACRGPCPARPAFPAMQAWLNTADETSRQRRRWNSPNRPPLATGPALRIRDLGSDNRLGLLLANLLGNHQARFFFEESKSVGKSVGKSAGRIAKASLPFPVIPQHNATRHQIDSPTALNLSCRSAVSSSCVRALQVLDPRHAIGRHRSPQLATYPFPPIVGFTIPPPGLCQAADVDVLQLIRTWLILVNKIERGRRMRQHHATIHCMGGWTQARKGTPASCFEAFLLFVDTCRFHTHMHLEGVLFTRPGEGHFLPSFFFFFFFISTRALGYLWVGLLLWGCDLSATAFWERRLG